jgi:hypothetical protein
MPLGVPIAFDSPRSGCVAACLLLAILLLLHRKTPKRPSKFCFAAGAILLATAAAAPVWNRPVAGTVAVLVDLSPSTRGATFRDRAALDDRIAPLLGRTPFQIFAFADRVRPLPPGPALQDLPTDQTVLTAPPCDAIVLFSDGRFPPPAGLPPVYAVIDPALNSPPDSAVVRLETSNEMARATVRQTGPRRPGHRAGAVPTADPLSAVPKSDEIRYTLSPGDLWPENDSLAIRRPTPSRATRWWVGDTAPPGWVHIKPAGLPTDRADYLGPAAVVLDDIPATDLSIAQQDALSGYVRDLGGGLILVGGDHAFGAGAYDRTGLDQLSPLASAPPDPAARWVILVDGSGSMASSVPGGSTAWQTESAAARAVIAALPAADKATVGSFAADITPWVTDVPAGRIESAQLPPAGVGPHGPTNLQAALESFTSISSPLATRVLLMTDADARLTGPEHLAAKLSARHVSLSVLATGDGIALPGLRSIAAATGGTLVEQPDATRWVSAAQTLARAARPDGLRETPVVITLGTASINVSQWTPTWLRDKTTVIARATDRPMAATWNAGLGRVAALAWHADPRTAQTVAATVAAPPADPRTTVTVDAGPMLRIAVDAVDGQTYLNGLHVTATVGDGKPVAVPQTAPGAYAVSVGAPRDPAIVTVFSDGRIIGRSAVAGRYPPEFDGIGNDSAALRSLASRTGGRVIEPGPASQIDFHWPTRTVPLFTPLVVTGLGGIGAGLFLCRRGNG